MKLWQRALLGFAIAAIVPVIVGLAGGSIYWAIITSEIPSDHLRASEEISMLPFFLVVAAGLSIPFAFFSILLFGIPIYELLNWRRLFSLSSYVIAGSCVSLVVLLFEILIGVIPLLGFAHFVIRDPQSIITAIGTLLSGPLATATFWLIRRPDRFGDELKRS